MTMMGDQDLMIVGDGMDIMHAKLYQYDHNSDSFTEVFAGTFRGMIESNIAWADYNQDGYQDIILTGGDNKGSMQSYTRILVAVVLKKFRIYHSRESIEVLLDGATITMTAIRI